MRKQVMMLILLLLSVVAWGEEPDGYYDDAQGKSGVSLQMALHDIIDGHTSLSYTPGVWKAYETTDLKADGSVWDMYSDVPNGTPAYTYTYSADQCGNYSGEGSCYNREHSFPKSWFSEQSPMVTDLFHVVPSDGYVNGKRSNYPFGEVGSASWTSTNGSKLGTCVTDGYSGTVFEPIDAYKGDFARIYFYMATRYYGEDSSWPGSPMVDGAEPKAWALAMLKRWHVADPVSQKEINRNDAIYTDWQYNRNPFVDHPEYVDSVWNGDTSIPEDTTVVDPTTDVTINMSQSDYQIIVDYVNADATLPNTDDHPDNTENYYGASAYHSNFDIRTDAYNSIFSTSDAAISTALNEVFLPARVDSSIVNVDYIINYTTYDGSNSGSGSKIYHCSSSDPLAFTAGAATVDPINPNPVDTTVVTPPDTTTTELGRSLTSLNLTFDRGLGDCNMFQLSGSTNWNLSTYNDNGYVVINTYEQGANESWLVTPAVNLDTLDTETFSFEITSYNFGKSIGDCGAGQFELYYSSTYDGSTIDKSQWTRITSVDDVMLGDAKWAWVIANVDVTSIAGSAVSFAFAHTSDASNGTTWEIDNVKLTGDIVASVKDVAFPQLELYPNPASSFVRLSQDADLFQVISISGQVVMTKSNIKATNEIDLSMMKKGIYLVRVRTNDENHTLKLLKK
ncbi:MAG: endonuclease [Bacteroidales bacterium]|jgi:endonuclease I|nr:endonuclease [Bacteroidales bacterium]